MTAQDRDNLPLADYDHLPISALRDRIRSLTSEEIEQLLTYEQAHGDRLPVVNIMQARLEQLEAGAIPTSGQHEVRPEQAPSPGSGSAISTDTAADPVIFSPNDIPAHPGDPNRNE